MPLLCLSFAWVKERHGRGTGDQNPGMRSRIISPLWKKCIFDSGLSALTIA